MRAFTVGTTPVQIADRNMARRFLSIQPVDGDVFVKYDGSSTDLTASNGQKVEQNVILSLVNSPGQAFQNEVWAVSASGDVDVRVQGGHLPE